MYIYCELKCAFRAFIEVVLQSSINRYNDHLAIGLKHEQIN